MLRNVVMLGRVTRCRMQDVEEGGGAQYLHDIVKLRQGSGKVRQGKARKGKERQGWRKVKGLKA